MKNTNIPEVVKDSYIGSKKLQDKVSLITGGDSGIGRSVAVLFAREGCDVAIVYLKNDNDAKETAKMVENEGRKCLIIRGDLGDEKFCNSAIETTMSHFLKINIIVNNAAEQHVQDVFENISAEQVEKTFRTNIFSFFFLIRAALPHLSKGDSIINTTSVTAYRGSEHLIDYSATKGAIVSLTRSLSKNLADRGIRVNGVAPGPIWTPLIFETMDEEKLSKFGKKTPMKRAGQASEVAPAFVFLASEDASYVTGQIIHVNGGEIVNA
jgi:NAD(P)-dependent dehydrogenase (short-subunit alcohol dehydrogenase family)